MPLFLEKRFPNEIALLVWKINESSEYLQAMLPSEILTDAELAEIHHEHKKTEFFASRLALMLLVEKLGVPYKGTKKDTHGKPYLVDTAWQMSLTHSRNFVAVAMHPTEAVGVDLEKPSDKILRIQDKFLSETEQIQANADARKLCIYWSAKEVLYKIYGKRKVIFKENLFLEDSDNCSQLKGRISMPTFEKNYTLFIEDIEDYILVVGK